MNEQSEATVVGERATMDYLLITSDEALARLFADHAGTRAVAIDTEFMRRDTYYPHAALIQLCFDNNDQRAWLVDPLTITDFEPLKALLQDTGIVKIMHSASEDLEVFQHFLDAQPQPLFDSQRAAAFAGGEFGLGYRALVASRLGLDLDKDATRSDWLARPLSEVQLVYAAADVVPLMAVYRELTSELEAADKLVWVLEDGEHAVAGAVDSGEPTHRRIKEAWKLDQTQLGVLEALCDWRERRAIYRDKPRNWILHDKCCLQIARSCPRSLAQLQHIEDLPPSVLRRQGDTLLDIVAGVLDGSADKLPALLPRPLTATQRDTVKKLKQAARKLAVEWAVAPEALLLSRDYELLARLGSGEEMAMPSRWQGWRSERLIQPLLQLSRNAASR